MSQYCALSHNFIQRCEICRNIVLYITTKVYAIVYVVFIWQMLNII